jgi:hypothetical protein
MKISSPLMILAKVSMILTMVLIMARSAEAAILSWSLSFTSGSNNSQVGAGAFSYDDEKVVVVRSPAPYWDFYIADKDAPIRPDFIPPFPGLWTVTKYPNPIVSFVANLPERTWNIFTPSWWNPDAPTLLGYLGCSRGSCGVSPQWFAGSPLGMAPGQFAMFGGTLGEDSNYRGSFISAPVPSSPNSFVSGTWTATAVPEPTTVAGAVIFGAGCLIARKKRSRCR